MMRHADMPSVRVHASVLDPVPEQGFHWDVHALDDKLFLHVWHNSLRPWFSTGTLSASMQTGGCIACVSEALHQMSAGSSKCWLLRAIENGAIQSQAKGWPWQCCVQSHRLPTLSVLASSPAMHAF